MHTGQEYLLAAGLRDKEAGAAVKKAKEPAASEHALTACSGEVWHSVQDSMYLFDLSLACVASRGP